MIKSKVKYINNTNTQTRFFSDKIRCDCTQCYRNQFVRSSLTALRERKNDHGFEVKQLVLLTIINSVSKSNLKNSFFLQINILYRLIFISS